MRLHVCCASLPYAKRMVAWDKSPWASTGCVKGKALDYIGLLLTQNNVFIMWLMGREAKLLGDAKAWSKFSFHMAKL